MPANIIVLSKRKDAKTFRIEEPVIRIGSHSDCNVVLAGIDPHALTLQFRDSRYLVLKRGKSDVWLNGKPLLDAQPYDWPPDGLLQLGSSVALRLVVDGDPAPAPRDREVGPLEDDTPVSETSQPNSTQVKPAQVVTLAICGILIVGMLLGIANTPPPPSVNTSQEFEQLVQDLLIRNSGSTRDDSEFRQLLQECRFHELRGESKLALACYGRVRNSLLQTPQDSSLAPNSSELEQRVLTFVKRRLEVLGTRPTS
jgi:hypothetical protein